MSHPLPTVTPRAVPLLFLDVDGTIRHGVDELGRFVNGPEDVIVFPEAAQRILEWRLAGGRVVAVSNQGGIALGLVAADRAAAAMQRTAELVNELAGVDLGDRSLIDGMCVCPHHPRVGYGSCWCRKPRPGLLHLAVGELADRYRGNELYPPDMAYMVGDRPEDEECARNAGIAFMTAETWRNSTLMEKVGNDIGLPRWR